MSSVVRLRHVDGAEQGDAELAGGHGEAPTVDGSRDGVPVQPRARAPGLSAPRLWVFVLPALLWPLFGGRPFLLKNVSNTECPPAAEEAGADAVCVASLHQNRVCQ